MSIMSNKYFDVLPSTKTQAGKRRFFQKMPQWDNALSYHASQQHTGLPDDVMKKESLTRLVEAKMGFEEEQPYSDGDEDESEDTDV